MKKTILCILVLVFICINANAQNSCSKFYPLIEGSSFEYTNTNKKGKTEGVTSYTISSVTQEGATAVAKYDLKYLDKKGKELYKSNYSIRCSENGINIDYESLIPSQMMSKYKDMGMEMDISGTDIEIPNNLSVGKELADANVTVNIDMGAIKMNISVDMRDRKVIKKENITTSAGTFDCYVLTQQITSKTMGANIQMSSRIWLAEGVGMVKQETYKKNGDLMSKTELTKYSK